MSLQFRAARSLVIQYQGGTDGILRTCDPRRGCATPDPTIGSLRYGKDYGYQYNVPAAGENTQRGRRFSLTDFIKEVLTRAATGGMAGAAFYGAVKESIRNLRTPKQRLALDLQFFADKSKTSGKYQG